MLTLILILLITSLIIKKPTIVENLITGTSPMASGSCNKENCGESRLSSSLYTYLGKKYKDYTNYLCNTRNNSTKKCISIPLVDQRPINTHPNSVKPLKFYNF